MHSVVKLLSLLFIKTSLKNIRFWVDRICKNEEEISLFLVLATFFLLSRYAEVLKRVKYVKDSILNCISLSPFQVISAVYREVKSCTTVCILEINTSSGSTQELLITTLLKCLEAPPKVPLASFFSFYIAFFFSKYLSILSILTKNVQLSFFDQNLMNLFNSV